MAVTPVRCFLVGFLTVCISHICSALYQNCYNQTEEGIICRGVNIKDVHVPPSVKSVTLHKTNTPYRGVFLTNNKWTNVEWLEIFSEDSQSFSGQDFIGLENLRHLGFHNTELWSIPPDTFNGLERLESLDLSDTRKPNVTQIMNSIATANLTYLTNLTLRAVDTYYPSSAVLADGFFSSITDEGRRQIKYMDISDFKISSLDFGSLFKYGLCNSLGTIICHRCVLLQVVHYWTDPCESLRVVDFSNMSFGMTMLPLDAITTDFFCALPNFYNSIDKMVMPGVFKKDSSPPMKMNGYTMDITKCSYRIRYVDFSNNALQWLNISAALNPITAHNFEWADVSNNILEYISPSFLAPTYNLRCLNFTGNRLFVMQTEYTSDFEELLSGQHKLEVLHLAKNNLSVIPRKMFASNSILSQLDLSENSLTAVDFEISHFKRLRYLDLRGNKISLISPSYRRQFDILTQNSDSTLKMNLGNNAFRCSCDRNDMEVLQWLKSNPSLIVADSEHYTCQLGDQKLNILTDALEITRHHCYIQQVKLGISIGIPIFGAFVLLLAIVIVIKRRRIQQHRRFKRRYHSVVLQIQNRSFPKENLVFLSCCSADNTFVTEYFMPKLTNTLRKMLSTERDLVCRGDAMFRPGFSISAEIIRCINETAVVVLIVSKEFCQKNWCKIEIREAFDQRKPIVLVMLEQVDKSLMDKLLKKIFEKYTHASWIDSSDGGYLEPDWDTFCRSLIGLAGKETENCSVTSAVSFDGTGVGLEQAHSPVADIETIALGHLS